MKEITTRAEIQNVSVITEFVEGYLEEVDAPPKVAIQLSVAIDEIFSNIAYYAYEDGGDAKITIDVTEADGSRTVELTFYDWGVPYNPLEKEDPDVTLSAEERGIGGLGIFMVKKSMDNMEYEYKDGQNILRLYKSF